MFSVSHSPPLESQSPLLALLTCPRKNIVYPTLRSFQAHRRYYTHKEIFLDFNPSHLSLFSHSLSNTYKRKDPKSGELAMNHSDTHLSTGAMNNNYNNNNSNPLQQQQQQQQETSSGNINSLQKQQQQPLQQEDEATADAKRKRAGPKRRKVTHGNYECITFPYRIWNQNSFCACIRFVVTYVHSPFSWIDPLFQKNAESDECWSKCTVPNVVPTGPTTITAYLQVHPLMIT